jgi:hypothetical protein
LGLKTGSDVREREREREREVSCKDQVIVDEAIDGY